MKQKHIGIIRACLKVMRAFGTKDNKSDIEETLKAFDKFTKLNKLRVTGSIICKDCNFYSHDKEVCVMNCKDFKPRHF